MDRKQQVLVKLKLKAKALGFNVKELKGIAAKIADNLTSKEDASDEDVNAEIDEKIDAVLPYLSFGQSQANRLLDEWKKNHPETDEEDDDNDDDININNQNRNKDSKNTQRNKGNDDAPEWAKSMMKTIESLNGEIAVLKVDKITTSRKSKLETLLKDTGTFGSRTLKSFSKMKFENDEEFDEFYSDVENDLKVLNQERADKGLSKLGTPPTIDGKGGKKEEVISDGEMKALIDSL